MSKKRTAKVQRKLYALLATTSPMGISKYRLTQSLLDWGASYGEVDNFIDELLHTKIIKHAPFGYFDVSTEAIPAVNLTSN